MAQSELLSELARILYESLEGVPLAANELTSFTEELAHSYLNQLGVQDFTSFSSSQSAALCEVMKQGVPSERLIAAMDSAGAWVRAVDPARRSKISLATSIAKMVIAQAYIESVKLSLTVQQA